MRALVVEDDEGVATLNARLLKREGFEVDVAMTVADGQRCAQSVEYDLIVLDLGLPDGSGLEVLSVVRHQSMRTPVLIVSGADELEATVTALDAGADDYVHKPYQATELRARVRALMRRSRARPPLLVCGNLVVNRIERTVIVGNETLTLAAKEFALLDYLLMNQNRTIDRKELLEKVWRFDFDPGTNMVDVNVSRLRAKLASRAASCHIESQRGLGYSLSTDSADH
jgi:DNA-binding response OmpR family regulator